MRTETAQRVVVLGREGPARDQLVGALGDLGVAPVWVGRPKQNNPDALLLLNPNKIVVSLEPAIELELEPYSEILGQPGISVVYDDAESSRGLQGWDLNRWARHFAAKLLGRSLLPPNPGQAVSAGPDAAAEPLAPAIDFSDIPVAADFAADAEPKAVLQWQDDSHYEELEIDQGELQKALERLNQNLSEGYSAEADPELSFELAPLTEEEDGLLQESDARPLPDFIGTATAFDGDGHAVPFVDDDVDSDSAAVSSDEDLRHFLAEAAATVADQADSQALMESAGIGDSALELALAPEDMEFTPSGQSNAVTAPEFDLSKYALMAADNETADSEAEAGTGKASVTEAEPRIRDGGKSGMFLVLSGIGGPGALRSLLEQVPADFQGIVALSHRIEATQMAAFRVQLQKVSQLPLEAIENYDYLKNGNIYLLPPDCTLFKTPLGYQCIRGGMAGFIDQIDHDAEILILSGADTSLSQCLIQVSTVSRNIHVQHPDDCYESDLARQLVNAGAQVLDRKIIEQWFN